MANLILTNACNLRCDFCFASEYLAGEADCATERMSLDEVERLLDFTGAVDARLCGGEPTTHPDILAILRLALEKKPGVFIMTNGVWPEAVRAFYAALPRRDRRRVRLLLNTLRADQYTRPQRAQLEQTLGVVEPDQLTLGFTIDRPDFDYGHVLELALRLGAPRVRFSVASPNVSDPGSWNLDPERDWPRVAVVVHQLLLDCERLQIQVNSDCGYLPPCVFTDAQRADLARLDLGERLRFSCEGANDIGPGGEAWRCYGLKSVVRADTADYEGLVELADEFERQTRALAEDRDLFDACRECAWRADGTCAGGCYALRAVRHAGALDDDALLTARPRVDGARLRLLEGAAMLQDDDGVWVRLPLSRSERRALERCDGARTVEEIVRAERRRDLLRDPARSITRAVRRFHERGALVLEDAR